MIIVCVCLAACEKKSARKQSTYDGKDGTSINYHRNTNVIQTEIEYKNRKMDGWYKSYYKSGQLKSEILFKEGKKNGIYKEFYEDGKLQSVRFYKADKADSVYQQFDREGRIKFKSYYKNGKQDGRLTTFYPSGKIRLEAGYRDDRQEGEEEIYYENGQLKSVNYYENGILGFGGQNFSETGKPLIADDYTILVEEINQMGLNSQYIYRFRLNKPVVKAQMYLISGELRKGQSLPPFPFSLPRKSQFFEHTFYVPRYNSLTEVMTVVAIVESEKGEKNITARKLNVSLNNFY
jgi:antitoxin component YwqK of YwqJK toxin-antitoxin module